MVHVGTRQARRAGILHDQQPALLIATCRARERLLRLDHDELKSPGGALGQPRALRLIETTREQARLVGLLRRGIAAGRESQLAWRARGWRVRCSLGCNPRSRAHASSSPIAAAIRAGSMNTTSSRAAGRPRRQGSTFDG